MLPEYEVYALRYATVERRARENFVVQDFEDRPMPMDYFVWAIRAEGRTVVVDTGFGQAAATLRKRRLLRSPAAGLGVIGIDAARVEDVVLTHLHYDHAGNLDLFPAARFHLQIDEMAYATGPAMQHGMFRHAFDVEDVVAMVRRVHAVRARFHDGDAELAPGITLHRLRGHTRGLQAVRVHTARGWVVLASDATHYRANMERRNPFPIVDDVAAMFAGYDRLLALADSSEHVIPGHDPEVLRRWPLHPADPDTACLHLAPLRPPEPG